MDLNWRELNCKYGKGGSKLVTYEVFVKRVGAKFPPRFTRLGYR